MRRSITIISSEFPPGPGGIGNHAYNLANWLHNSGYKVCVLANSRNSNDEIFFDRKISYVVKRTTNYQNRFFKIIMKVIFLFRALLNNGSESIIISSGRFPLLFCGAAKLLFKKNKFIAVIHGSEVNSPKFLIKILVNWCLKNIDNVIAVSKYTKGLIKNLNNDINIDVIHNGFDISKFKNGNHFNNKIGPHLITVGSITERKGQKNVIRALPKIKSIYPEVSYSLVGMPIDKEDIMQYVNELSLKKQVTIYGALSDEKMIELLRCCDIFIMLSEETKFGDVEGFGIAVLEANHCGLPAIGSKNTGIEDAISVGFSGLVVDAKSDQEICSAIKIILNDYDQFSKNSKVWSEKFTWRKVIKKYIHIIEK